MGRYRGRALCVVHPSTTEQVAAVVRLCAAANVPMLAQGGNTSLCGGAVPASQGQPPVIISLARMRRIRHIDAANGSMEVEAGCVLKTVQDAAADASRFYPVSLGAEGSRQIGGTLSTDAGGTSVLRYGNTRENVLGLEVVMADGTIWNGLRALRKDNTGIYIKQLFIGAEGTLGIVTAATLKLHPLPAYHALAWLAPVDPAAAHHILAMFQANSGSRLSAFELMNARQLQLVTENVANRRAPLKGRLRLARARGAVRHARCGGHGSRVAEHAGEAIEAGLIIDAIVATSDTQRATLWEIRHSVTEANKKAGVGLTTDCAVPVSAVPASIESATRAVRALDPQVDVVIVGHMGDGNIHFIPFYPFDAWRALPDCAATGAAMRRAVNDVAASLNGTFSAEHGVGQSGLAEMAHYKSAAELSIMRAIKQALDPRNLMNPGRLFP